MHAWMNVDRLWLDFEEGASLIVGRAEITPDLKELFTGGVGEFLKGTTGAPLDLSVSIAGLDLSWLGGVVSERSDMAGVVSDYQSADVILGHSAECLVQAGVGVNGQCGAGGLGGLGDGGDRPLGRWNPLDVCQADQAAESPLGQHRVRREVVPIESLGDQPIECH